MLKAYLLIAGMLVILLPIFGAIIWAMKPSHADAHGQSILMDDDLDLLGSLRGQRPAPDDGQAAAGAPGAQQSPADPQTSRTAEDSDLKGDARRAQGARPASPTSGADPRPGIGPLGRRLWVRLGDTFQLLGLRGGKGLALVGALAALVWLASGIYLVQPDEQGIVLRVGRWVATTGPGLHYHLPWPVEALRLPKVTQIRQLELVDLGEGAMPTGDENLVDAKATVFWRIGNAGEFLFNTKDPELALQVAAESALTNVIARTPIEAAMATGRQQVADEAQALLQRWLDEERSGIVVTDVVLQSVDPPSEVIDAFNDVQRARADEARERNVALAYRNKILPAAQGEANRILADAAAYQSQVVDLAQGQAKRFTALDATYRNAPNVTAWRLYLDSIDAVLKKANRVIVLDSSAKSVPGVIPYLPLHSQGSTPAGSRR
ncbi:MAG: FtsH protease activity modulator HflK [Betaproteobacteria bacterium]|nr:FtsH protease activity modulator HflK [Betaproteobacteria bacterium]